MRTLYLIVLAFSLFVHCTNPVASTGLVVSPQRMPVQDIKALEIHSRIPEFNLPGVDGRWYNQDDFSQFDILVVTFLSNHCPNSQVYEERLNLFVEDYADKKVGVVAISPNSPLTVPDDMLGFSDLDDSFKSMQVRAGQKGFLYPYLYDGDRQKTAVDFGVSQIPTAYIFDQARLLRYRGRLDVNPLPKQGNMSDIRLVVDALVRGDTILRPERDFAGCPVHWSWDTVAVAKLEQEWSTAKVTLRELSLDSLITLMTNFSSNVRIFNFWATWCGPCKREFPEFLTMMRMYRHRPVEFISICLDSPEQRDAAFTFLKQLHAPGRNFILKEQDKDLIRKNVYEDWDGSLPFTLMVEPLGEKSHFWIGEIDPIPFRKDLVEHRLLGRYLR